MCPDNANPQPETNKAAPEELPNDEQHVVEAGDAGDTNGAGNGRGNGADIGGDEIPDGDKPKPRKAKVVPLHKDDEGEKANETPPPRKHWDAASLRVDPTGGTPPGAKPLITRIGVDKPNKQDFVRVHPGDEYRLPTRVLKHNESRESYIVIPPLTPLVMNHARLVELRLGVNVVGILFVWPAPLMGPDEKSSAWHDSHRAVIEAAEKNWVCMWADQASGQYMAMEAEDDLGEPKWPDMTLDEILNIAFKGRIIDDIDHPVLKALRGKR